MSVTAGTTYTSRPVDHAPARVARFAGLAPWMHAVLRIAAGLLFMEHGAQKLFGMFGGFGGPGGHAELASKMGFAGILEFFGGLFVALGFLTRPVAFLLAGEMFVAYVQAHLPHGAVPIENHGELALLYAFVFAYLAAAGAGPASVDSAIRRRS